MGRGGEGRASRERGEGGEGARGEEKRREEKSEGSRREGAEPGGAGGLGEAPGASARPAARVSDSRALPPLRAALHNKIYFKTQLKETGRLHVTV